MAADRISPFTVAHGIGPIIVISGAPNRSKLRIHMWSCSGIVRGISGKRLMNGFQVIAALDSVSLVLGLGQCRQ